MAHADQQIHPSPVPLHPVAAVAPASSLPATMNPIVGRDGEIAALVDASLLRLEQADDGEPRVGMLETIRDTAWSGSPPPGRTGPPGAPTPPISWRWPRTRRRACAGPTLPPGWRAWIASTAISGMP